MRNKKQGRCGGKNLAAMRGKTDAETQGKGEKDKA
jgi:hypothetical protein